MTSLKDKIQHEIKKNREQSENPAEIKGNNADVIGNRLDEIRPRLDQLSHAEDNYSLKVDYAVGPYSETIAIVELYGPRATWVASWQIAATVGDSAEDWEVTYNPHGVETQHEWFHDADGLFAYLTASIAQRIITLQADED